MTRQLADQVFRNKRSDDEKGSDAKSSGEGRRLSIFHLSSKNIQIIEEALSSRSEKAIRVIPIELLRSYASGSDANIENILNSRSERVIELIIGDRLEIYASQSIANLEKILSSRSEKAINLIPIDKLNSYVGQPNLNIKKILSSRYERVIKKIPVDKLKVYASGGDVNIGRILSSRSDSAIAVIPSDMLMAYVNGDDTNMGNILNSRSSKTLDLISGGRLKAYASRSTDNLEKILNSRSERAIRMIPYELLRSYATDGDTNIENILNSQASRAIDLIPDEKLKTYASQDIVNVEKILSSRSEKGIGMISINMLRRYASGNDADIENILSSRVERAIELIPAHKLTAYADKSNASLERVLRSKFVTAINCISSERLIAYANQGDANIGKILSSGSDRAIGLIPDEKLITYSDKGDAYIEKILASQMEAIDLIPIDKLKLYAGGGDANIEKILSSRYERVIAVIPINLLRAYASGGNANIEKILSSGSDIAIDLISDKKLKAYASENNASIEKILSSGSNRAIKLIPHDHLSFYADVMRRRFGKVVSTLERQGSSGSSGSFEMLDLTDEDIARIEELLDSHAEMVDLFSLDKLIAYAEGGDANIEKILSSRSDKMIDLIPVNQLATYARKGNKYIENILDSRSMRAVNLISITQLKAYVERGEEDRIEKILNSRTDRAIGLISNTQLIAYANQSDVHLEKILDSHSYRAISLMAEKLRAYARKNASNIEKILYLGSDEAVSFIANQLEVYANQGNANIERILSSGSDKAIALIPTDTLKAYARQSDSNLEKILESKFEGAISLVLDQLKSYASQGNNAHIGKILDSLSNIAIDTIPVVWLTSYAREGDVNIGKILSSRSERAIGMISSRILSTYADGSDAHIEEILNSQSSKVIRLIPVDKLKAYVKRGDANIEKVLSSRSNIAIATIPANWLVKYAKGGDANIEKILSSHSEIALDLIPEKKISAYARQGEVNVGKIIASGSDSVIKLIPYDSLSLYAQTMHQQFERVRPHLDDLNKAISRVKPEACLYTAAGRSKKEALREGCEISWDDVDEFNEEKTKPREFKEIKINSEQFLSYIQSSPHSESKRIQLLQLADKVSVIGNAKERVSNLVRYQNTLFYLNKINRVSSITMSGMVAKNILGDFLREDYQDVAVNLGFIAGGGIVHKVAEVAAVQGEKLFAGGQRFLGQSLKLASPFIARGTSAFIAYDLVNQIKAYAQGDPDALVGMVGDGIYLGIEGAEVGIEIAEIVGVLEGVSAFTGPIGAGIGALIFIGQDVYLAAKRIEREDELIHLTNKEKWIEGLRALLGIDPQADIEALLEEKRAHNQLYLQGIAFLKKHTDIQRYVFKMPILIEECKTNLIRKCRMQLFGYAVDCYRREPVIDTKCVAAERWEKEVSSVVILDEKRKNIMLRRTKPDAPEGTLFCPPVAPLYSNEAILAHDLYLCDNAIGIEYSNFRTGNTTFISLGDGDDTVVGFPDANHIMTLGNGYKSISLGVGDDTIFINGSRVAGLLIGGGGLNTLDLGSFAGQEIVRMSAYPIPIKLDSGPNPSSYIRDHFVIETKLTVTSSLQTRQFQRFLFRANQRDEILLPGCDIHFIDGRGGIGKQGGEDFISINRDRTGDNCISDLTLVVRPYTIIYNFDINESSLYSYIVPLQEGSATISIFSNCAFNRFIFEAKLLNLDSFNWNNRSSTITFGFLKSKQPLERFNLLIDVQKSQVCSSDRKRLLFQLGDSAEIRMIEDKFYVFEKTNRSVEEIVKDYPGVANRFNFSIIVNTLLTDESIVIGHGLHDVLHNDPYRRSHLIGNGGENIFVVNIGDRILNPMQLPLPDVVLYDADDKNLIDTLDLRQIKNQLEKSLELEVKARVSLIPNTSDMAIELFSSDHLNECLITIRLKDALLTNWHRRLHIILNHVPLKLDALHLKPLSLKFSPKQQGIIIISAEDIEENIRLIIPKRIGAYHFTRWGESDLIMTNAFDKDVIEPDRYALLFRKFYQDDVSESIVLEFVDKELALADEIDHIEYAANFAWEHEFYNRTLFTMLLNKNVTVLPASRVQIRRSHPEIQDEMMEEKGEANESIWGRIASYVLPTIAGIGAMVTAGMGAQRLRRFRANAMPAVAQPAVALPLLTPTIEAKSTKQQEKIGSNSQQSYSEQNSRVTSDFYDNAVGNVSLLKSILHFLNCSSAVARMNQAEHLSSNINHEVMSPLDLAIQRIQKALPINEPNPHRTSWAVKRNSSTFFQPVSVPPSSLNDTQINVSGMLKIF